jgi:high affinity Mn2+ porin
LGLLAIHGSALAADVLADVPVRAPVPHVSPAYDWNGWYAGVHVSVIRGSSNWSANPPGAGGPVLGGSFDFPLHFDFMGGTGSYAAGIQGGYNYDFPSRLMLGFEADVSSPNSTVAKPNSVRGSLTVTSPLNGQVTYGEEVIHSGTARARVGYAFNHFLFYGTGGLAWTYDRVTRAQVDGNSFNGLATPGTVDSKLLWRLGWVAGIGRIPRQLDRKSRISVDQFGSKGVMFPVAAEPFASTSTHWRRQPELPDRRCSQIPNLVTESIRAETDRFAFHAQATMVAQYNPRFGLTRQNSLIPNIGRETTDLTMYAVFGSGRAEAWINPELDRGFGWATRWGRD